MFWTRTKCKDVLFDFGDVKAIHECDYVKTLKRMMAGEYSRELGVKVYEGQRRLARLGFRVVGNAGFGMRRLVVSADGHRRGVLKKGERKAIASDRIILMPGPKGEVETVRKIFALGTIKTNTLGESPSN